MAGCVREIEDCSKEFETIGLRLVVIRTGIVLSATGGALPKMINPLTGEDMTLPDTNAEDGAWQYPKQLKDDWVFIIKKKNDNPK